MRHPSAGAVSTVNAGAAWTDVDPFAEVLSAAEQIGATLRAFIAHPGDALALSTLKQTTGSRASDHLRGGLRALTTSCMVSRTGCS